MQRNDFVFTIGFKGSSAIVDRKLRSQYGNLSTLELYKKGLLKQAVASAFFEQSQGRGEALKDLIAEFKSDYNEELSEEDLYKIYGIVQHYGDKTLLV